MTNPDRRRLLRRVWPTALGVTTWLLAGCAPGSGGTGVPTGASAAPDGSSSASAPAPTAAPAPATPTPTPALTPAPVPAPARLPTTPPLLEGPIDALDAVTVVVAGNGFTRATLRVVLADGTDAPAALVGVGARLRIWTVTGGHLALLLQ